jgi:hypothetical protein
MTYEEARQRAIDLGALKPQTLTERMAAGVMASRGQWFSNTVRAQGRLEAWTRAVLQGQDPRRLG